MNPRERRVNVGRLELHVLELGEGPAVLLLHGFPAYSADWQGQMRALAQAGFRAIAPDLPGYGQSAQLPKLRDYRAHLLAGDLAGLIRGLGLQRAHVVGHDWGGALAYCLAALHPELVERLVVINAPHPELLRSALLHFEQLRRSWYMFLFQVPLLAEWLVQRRFSIALALRGMAVRPSAFPEPELDRYWNAIRIPGVARAALRYYRASFLTPMRLKEPVQQPTLVLWGEQDQALSARLLLTDLARYVPRARVLRFEDAGHWLHHDLPDRVSAQLTEFLSAAPAI